MKRGRNGKAIEKPVKEWTSTFDSVKDLIMVVDGKNTILKANRATADFLGLPMSGIIGKTCCQLMHGTGTPPDICPLKKMLKTGRREELELHIREKNVWVNVSVDPVRDECGNIVKAVHIVRDITDSKRAEEAVRRSEEAWRSLADNAPSIILIIDRDRTILYTNQPLAAYSTEEIVGKKVFDFADPGYHDLIEDTIEAVFRTGDRIGYEVPVHYPDGNTMWYHALLGPIRNNGRIESLIMHCTDITEQKRAREEIEAQKTLLEEIFNGVQEGIGIVDENENIIFCNPAYGAIFEEDHEELPGKNLRNFLDDETYATILEQTRNRRSGRSSEYEVPIITAKGNRKIIRVNVSPRLSKDGIFTGTFGTILDITDQKQAEDRLKKSRRELAIRNRFAEVFLTVADEEMFAGVLDIILDVMESKYGVFGYINEDGAFVVPSMTRHIWEKCQVQDKTIIFPRNTWGDSSWPRAITEKRMIYSNEPSEKIPRGHIPIERHISQPILFHGNVIGLIQIANKMSDYTEDDFKQLNDITDFIAPILDARLERDQEERNRRKIEEELCESEERYRDIFENANDLIQSVSPSGRFVYVNRAWRELLGYSKDQIRNMKVFDIIHPDSRTHCIEVFQRIMNGEDINYIETEFVASDGRVYQVEGNISCKFEGEEPVATRGIFRDITERKKVDRMKDEFISTVSHELRTPLTSIHSALSIISQGKVGEIPDGARNFFDIAVRNSERLKNLINDLLDLQKIETGKVAFQMKPLKLGSLVKQLVEENKAFGEQFNVEFVLEGDFPEVEVNADDGRLGQVMNNLLSNAAKFTAPKSTVEVSIARYDGKARVSVKDYGDGIPEEFRDRVFQRFTQADSSKTRKRGGTGLGLSIAKSIVELHGGKIDFDTKTGVGTTFYFELPEWKGRKDNKE